LKGGKKIALYWAECWREEHIDLKVYLLRQEIYMKRFYQLFRITIVLLNLVLLLGCIPKMTIKETPHYKIYENIVLTAQDNVGRWIKTDIDIPKGTIVAVMVKGKIWDITDPSKWQWQANNCLRFKIGKGGLEEIILGGVDYLRTPSNINVVPSGEGGRLYLGMGTMWREPYPQSKRGEFTVRVIVWEKGHQDQIEGDLLELIRTHPKDRQFCDLVAFVAFCLNRMREYEKVQNLYKMMGETPDIDWSRAYPFMLEWMSDLEGYFGRNESAKFYAEESLNRIRGFGDRYSESALLRRLGTIASKLGQYEEASKYLEESLKISKSLNHPSYVGASLYWIGDNLLRMNKPDEAVKYLKDALEYFNQIDMYFMRRSCYLSLGRSYMRLNKNIEAKKSFESAIEMAAKISDPDIQWRSHGFLGRIAEKEENNQKAFEHYAKAISIIESMRAKFADPSLKTLFMKDKSRVYERMIQLLYKMQRTPEAFHYLERARARVMLDMLAEKTLSSKNKEENELLNQDRDLRKRIEEISTRQEKISFERPQGSEEEISEPQKLEKPISELERLHSQHRAILEKLESLNSELASLVSINPLKASEIQELLDGETILIEYFIGMENRFIFLVTKEKVLAVPLEVDSKILFQKIREFRDRAVEGITLDRLFSKAYERPLSDLYEILIQPIEKEILGKKNLIIVPHGMLHYLPFQALLSRDRKYLIESFSISYLPSATVLKYARAKNKGNRLDLFAAGNPVTGFELLPAAEEEVREVSTLFEKRLVLTGREATKASIKSQSPRYDLLHLSTHGEMIESNPLKSNLRFTPSGKDDGRLTVSEIFDMEIKANLVTLSACETALGKGETGDFPQGDDLVGLSRAFIHAGAPSVVASLWKVSDDSTVQLMKTFYQNLRGMPKAEALRKAQLDLRKSTVRFTVTRAGGGVTHPVQKGSEETIECSHPFFWAPFILLGDWR
jgi:CHAT domain-containing protein